MSRFKNETGGVLTVTDLMRQVGPYEEFEWPGHDPEVHGLPTGCAWLDPPEPEAETPAGEADNGSEGDGAGEGTAGGAESDADGSADPQPGDDPKTPRRRGKAADKESGE